MNNVDVNERTFNLGERGKIPIHPEDVERVLGLPAEGVEIMPFCKDGMEDIVKSIKKILMLDSAQKLDMEAIENIVLQEYPEVMSNSQRISLLVAVVIYAVSYFLAPRGNPPELNYDVLCYLTDPMSAFCVNWSKYVLDVLMESCKKVKKERYWMEKEKCTLDGCILVLQVY
jgi:hypothetical protein